MRIIERMQINCETRSLAVSKRRCDFCVGQFLPHCMECNRGLVMRKLFICQTRALWQNGRKICPGARFSKNLRTNL